MSVSGNTALIGAPYRPSGSKTYVGAVFNFQSKNGGITWKEIEVVTASDAGQGYFFGYAIAIDGNLALIGSSARVTGGKTNSGGVYVFDGKYVPNKPGSSVPSSVNEDTPLVACNCS